MSVDTSRLKSERQKAQQGGTCIPAITKEGEGGVFSLTWPGAWDAAKARVEAMGRDPEMEGKPEIKRDPEEVYWVAFNMIPGIGSRRFLALLEHFGSARAAWEAPPAELEAARGIGRESAQRIARDRVNVDPLSEVGRASRLGFSILTLRSESYPRALKEIYDPPPVIYVAGELPPDSYASSCAIVGTRRPSAYGRNVAMRLASDLARCGIIVVSGMARGVDSIVHRAVLDAGGTTVAVLGSGLDVPYPPENAGLAKEIAKHGACISEFPLGTAPLPANFPARNRIISGLARGVVVVEGERSSGAMITARFAVEQGRDVFAIPGPVTSERSRGPHSLIKDGATLIEGAEDILTEWGIDIKTSHIHAEGDIEFTKEEALTLSHLEGELQIDDLVEKTGLTAPQVAVALTGLELRGKVMRLAGDIFIRKG